MAMMISVIKSTSLLLYIQSISANAKNYASSSAYSRSVGRESAINIGDKKDSVYFRGLNKNTESEICPIDRAAEVGVYQVPPNGNKLSEVSYMAHSSQVYKGKAKLVWMGSDKAQNELLAVDLEKGVIVQNFLLDVPLLGDWESLTRGPCSSTKKKTCLYIGNMGNNHANSCINTECTFGNSVVYVYKLEEPIIGGDYRGTAIKVATMQISYTGSNFPTNRANSESLFVDHTGDQKGGKPGDLYFITKFMENQKLQRLGKISVEEHEDIVPGSSKRVAVRAVGIISQKLTWTDATMNEDGTVIALLNYNYVVFFYRSSAETVADALQSRECPLISSTERTTIHRQFESLTFMPFPYYVVTSECLFKEACTLNVYRYKLMLHEQTMLPSLTPENSSSQHAFEISTVMALFNPPMSRLLLGWLVVLSLLLVPLIAITFTRFMMQKFVSDLSER